MNFLVAKVALLFAFPVETCFWRKFKNGFIVRVKGYYRIKRLILFALKPFDKWGLPFEQQFFQLSVG